MVDNTEFGLQGQIWITAGEQSMGGHGRIHLLSKIAELGSISQAAKSMKMSYKSAWDAVDHMNNLAGEPLLHRISGGKGGGSTTLTERGKQLITNFQRIEQIHQRFLQELSQETGNIIDDLFVLKRLSMKTSARNQFFGTVKSIQVGAINDAIEITTVTRESTQELDLKVGREVFALIKASSIILVSEAEDVRFSARNQFAGTVARIQTGAVNSEVVVSVGDSTLAVIITNDSAKNLELKEGSPVTAIFKASSVIVGRPL